MLRTGRKVCETEGLRGLLGRWARFLLSRPFEYSTYYLYAKPVGQSEEVNEAGPTTHTSDLTFRAVSSNAEADELEAQGFDFRWHVANARERLDRGAVGTCVFIGKELAHIGWVAVNQHALDRLNEPPYKVDFANGEVVVTGVWTNPKHRGRRLGPFCDTWTRRMMRENGFTIRRHAARRSGIGWSKRPMRVSGRFAGAYGEGRYLRVLWWKSWKEKPFPHDEGHRA